MHVTKVFSVVQTKLFWLLHIFAYILKMLCVFMYIVLILILCVQMVHSASVGI